MSYVSNENGSHNFKADDSVWTPSLWSIRGVEDLGGTGAFAKESVTAWAEMVPALLYVPPPFPSTPLACLDTMLAPASLLMPHMSRWVEKIGPLQRIGLHGIAG